MSNANIETPAALKIDAHYLANLSEAELRFLWLYADSRQAKFPAWAGWLGRLARGENARREDPRCEMGMIELPPMTSAELSDFLMGSYSLSHMPLSSATARLVDQLTQHIVAHSATILGLMGGMKV